MLSRWGPEVKSWGPGSTLPRLMFDDHIWVAKLRVRFGEIWAEHDGMWDRFEQVWTNVDRISAGVDECLAMLDQI